MYSEVGIVMGFSVLALMLSLKKPVWLALLLASLTMGFIGVGPYELVELVFTTTFSATTIDLLVVVFLITILVNLYNTSGFIAELGNELVKLLRKPKLVASLVPAIMGLLPVPGGALMSAPVVETVCDYMGLSNERKLFINVWFRHVIFVVYPLSTVLLATASLAGVNTWSLILRGLPVVFAMVISGYILSFRGARSSIVINDVNADKAELLRVFSPMLTAILVAVITSPLLDKQLISWIPLTRYSMILGLVIAISLLVKLSGTNPGSIAKAVKSRNTIELVIASFAAVLLRDVFMAVGGPRVVSGIIPLGGTTEKLVFMVLIPFVVSLATGSPITGVVFAISVFKPLVNFGIRETALVYASNMLGYIASPAHLCYVYTAQYFKVPLTSAYREIFIATIVTLVTAVVQFLLI